MRNKIRATETAIRYLPIVIVESYFLCVLGMYFLGSLSYNSDNRFQLFLFLISCDITLLGGYIWFMRFSHWDGIKRTNVFNGSRTEALFLKYFWALVALCVVCMFLRINVTMKITSPLEYIRAVCNGVIDPAGQYAKKYFTLPQDSKIYLLGCILIDGMFAFLTFSFLPLTVFFSEKLSVMKKIGAYIIMTLLVSLEICTGSNAGSFILFVILAVALGIKIICHIPYKKWYDSLRGNIGTIVALIFLAFFCVGFFSLTIGDRTNGSITAVIQNDGITLNKPTSPEPITPKPTKPETSTALNAAETSAGLQYYFGNGIRNLGLALQEPFVPTYGAGHSQTFSSIIENLFGVDLFSHTYANRMRESGKISFTVSPFYADAASDISFPGVIVLMFGIGVVFAFIWKTFLYKKSFTAYLLIIISALFYISIYSNNLVLNDWYDYFAMCEYLLILILEFFHKRKRIPLQEVKRENYVE